jgi:ABC-type branched-subunit amino acid transport system substrate-binding protein
VTARPALLRWLGALAAGATFAAGVLAQPLASLEQAGKRLYDDGLDRSGRPIEARVAGSATPLKGKALACGNCHGEDGRGRPESGVDPGDVTWTDLTKPYGHAHANNRRHGPYDRRSFIRAMHDGVDPAGNPLEPAMPRYDLDDASLDALIAYLKRLDRQTDAGITDTTLRIGTVLPASGRLADTGRAVQRVLQGHLDGVNARGGVHGRQLQLVVAPAGEDDAAARAALDRLLVKEPVLALLAPLTARHERAFATAAEQSRVPLVGPLTLFPESASASSTYVFHLLPGVPELAEALAVRMHPVLALSGRPIVLLHAPGADGQAAAQAVEAHLKARGYSALFLEPAGPPEGLAQRLQQREANAVIVLSPGAGLTAIVRAAAAAGVRPHWLIPAPFVPSDILEWPPELDGRVMLAYPTLPADHTPAGTSALAAAAGGEPTRGHLAMQGAALAASMVLVEGLSRAGRDLSRQKLLAALESLQGFDTGLMPPIRYNADRRIGSYGAFAVKVDLANRKFQPSPDFIRLQ